VWRNQAPVDSAGVPLSGKKVLLTGGAGFIGTSLARRLVEDNEIVILDNLHRDSLSGTDLAQHANLRFVEGDVLDLTVLRELAARATHVVHLAAIAGVDKVLESRVRTMRVNLIGTYNVLEAAAQADGIERLVDFSTSEVFGTHAYKVEETHVTTQGSVGEARWTYAVSKLAGEYLAHSYFDEFGLPAVSVRPFNVYGPGQVGSGAIHHFTARALAGDELVIHGDGSQIRAWCYVDDVVDALLAILDRDEAVGQVFNVGNPRSVVTVFDLASRIRRLTGSESEIVFQPLHYTDVEMRIPNVDKARKLLAWEPQVDLDEGLARTIAWYRERRPVQSLAPSR
jgi:nucleoside-diphosphate-sugar epimerase